MGSRSRSVRRWWDHRKDLWNVSPGELVALQKAGTIGESLKGYAALAQEEALALVNALGGENEVSTQRMLLIRDTARLGLVLRAVMGRFVQGEGDPELASKVATLTSARRANLSLLGLERHEREITLTDYLNARDTADERSQDELVTGPEPESPATSVSGPGPEEKGSVSHASSGTARTLR